MFKFDCLDRTGDAILCTQQSISPGARSVHTFLCTLYRLHHNSPNCTTAGPVFFIQQNPKCSCRIVEISPSLENELRNRADLVSAARNLTKSAGKCYENVMQMLAENIYWPAVLQFGVATL